MTAPLTRPIVIRMSEDLYQAIKMKAASNDRSMAQEIRHVLREYTAPESVGFQYAPAPWELRASGTPLEMGDFTKVTWYDVGSPLAAPAGESAE